MTHEIDATDEIQRLNDQLRQTGCGGRTMMTAAVAALPDHERMAVLEAVASFTAFDARNDPHGEHDCAVLRVGSHEVLWKIDYYDTDLVYGSPDPANPELTCRVLTIMLTEEY